MKLKLFTWLPDFWLKDMDIIQLSLEALCKELVHNLSINSKNDRLVITKTYIFFYLAEEFYKLVFEGENVAFSMLYYFLVQPTTTCAW